LFAETKSLSSDCVRLREFHAFYGITGAPLSPTKTLAECDFSWKHHVILETRVDPTQSWPPYDPKHTILLLFVYLPELDIWRGPIEFPIDHDADLGTLRRALSHPPPHITLPYLLPPEHQCLVCEEYGKEGMILEGDEHNLRWDLHIHVGTRIFLEPLPQPIPSLSSSPSSPSSSSSSSSSPSSSSSSQLSPSTEENHIVNEIHSVSSSQNLNCANDSSTSTSTSTWKPHAFEEIQRLKNSIEVSFNIPDTQPTHRYKLNVNCKMTLGEFKQLIQPYIHLTLDEFKVLKGSKHSRFELKNEKKTLEEYGLTHGTKLTIQKGKPLRRGETLIKFVFFNLRLAHLQESFCEPLFELLLPEDMSVYDAKVEVCRALHTNQIVHDKVINQLKIAYPNISQFSFTPDTIRLRELCYRSPSNVSVCLFCV
jgi:hypothetical protein